MIKVIPSKDLESLYRKYWNMDKEAIIAVHECDSEDLETCIKTTMEPLGNFKVFEFDNDMGFFGFEQTDYLTTFFVNPKNRNRKDMKSICDTISHYMDKTFYTALFDKNDKAQKFIINNGGKVENRGHHLGKDFTLFKIQGGFKCQFQL